jgi:hypothetical protein
MSVKLMTDVFESDLEPTRRMVALIYANFANDDGENSWPSVSTISRMTGLTDRAVRTNVKTLVADKILVPDGQSKYRTNRFKLNRSALLDYKREVKSEFDPESDSPSTLNQIHPESDSPLNQIHPHPESDSPSTLNQIHPYPESDSPNPLILNTDPSNTSDKTGPHKTIWDSILQQFHGQCDKVIYRTYLEPVDPIGWDGKTLTLGVANSYTQELIRSRFEPSINHYLSGIAGLPDAHANIIVRPPNG